MTTIPESRMISSVGEQKIPSDRHRRFARKFLKGNLAHPESIYNEFSLLFIPPEFREQLGLPLESPYPPSMD